MLTFDLALKVAFESHKIKKLCLNMNLVVQHGM